MFVLFRIAVVNGGAVLRARNGQLAMRHGLVLLCCLIPIVIVRGDTGSDGARDGQAAMRHGRGQAGGERRGLRGHGGVLLANEQEMRKKKTNLVLDEKN